MRGIFAHHKARGDSDEWLAPPWILEALGPFDLDPCSPVVRPWDTARRHYTMADDGFNRPWRGRVWLNPPYGRHTNRWLAKLAEHGNGVALIFARTETIMFFRHVWPRATAVLFLEGRLTFHLPDGSKAGGNAGGPSVLIAYGPANAATLASAGIKGKYVHLRGTPCP